MTFSDLVFPISFFQDWFSIWPNQSSKLVNQAEPVGLTGAGWNRAGKDKEAPFWKKACQQKPVPPPPASEHCPKREPIPLFTTPADAGISWPGDVSIWEVGCVKREGRVLSSARKLAHRPGVVYISSRENLEAPCTFPEGFRGSRVLMDPASIWQK